MRGCGRATPLFLLATAAVLAACPAHAAGQAYGGEPDAQEFAARSMTVLTGEEIRASGATSAAEAVRLAAGTNLLDQGPRGTLQWASLRGADAAQVLVLLDGRRMNSPADGRYDLSALPVTLDEIDRIEVLRGGASDRYGSGAVGGVVNIVTRRPAATGNRIGGSVGSRGYDTIILGSTAREKTWYYSFSGIRETSDGYRLNSDLQQEILGGKIGVDLGAASFLELTADYISRENGMPGSTAIPTPGARQRVRNRVYGVTYAEQPGKDLALGVSLHRIEDDLQAGDQGSGAVSRQESVIDGGEARVTWSSGAWSRLTAGYEMRRESLDSGDTGSRETSLTATSLQETISAGDSLVLVVGGRYDDHEISGERFSPRAGIRYRIAGAGTVLRASYSESFRGPTLRELYAADAAGNRGNPALRPETAEEYEAGIDQPLGATSMIRITWFERDVDDLIILQEFAPSRYWPVNGGSADIEGIEAEASLPLGKSSLLSASYALTDPVDGTTGERIYAHIPRTQIKGSLLIAVDAETYLRFEGRAVENYVRPGESEWRYSVYDGKIGQKLSRGGGDIYFGMRNIFDRRYETLRGYPMPPKEIYGGLTFFF